MLNFAVITEIMDQHLHSVWMSVEQMLGVSKTLVDMRLGGCINSRNRGGEDVYQSIVHEFMKTEAFHHLQSIVLDNRLVMSVP